MRLDLQNFRGHARLTVHLAEGINFIHGPNGAGKTTVMEAVAVALYGSEWVRRVGSTWGAYLRRGAAQGEARLRLGQLEVARRFTAEGSQAAGTHLAVDGRPVARGDREVTEEVKRRLGLSVEEFRNLAYVRQGELRRILTDPEYLDRLLRLDEFDRFDEVAREALERLTAEEARARGQLEELERSLREARERLRSREAELAGLAERLKALEPAAQQYRQEESRHAELAARAASLRKELEGLRKEHDALLERLVQLEAEAEEAERAVREAEEAAAQLAALPQVEDVEEAYHRAAEALRRAQAVPPEVRAFRPEALEEARRALEEARAKLAEANARLSLLADVLRLAERGGGRCPICGSPLSPEVVEGHRREAQEARRRAAQAEAEARRLAAEVERLERLARERARHADYLDLDVESLRRQVEALAEKVKLRREVERRRSYLAAKAEGLGRARARLQAVREERAKAEARLAEVQRRFNALEAEAEEAERRLEEARARLQGLRTAYEEYQRLSGMAVQLRNEVEHLRSAVAELEAKRREAAQRAERLGKALRRAEAIRAAMRELKPLARQVVMRHVNAELNAVFLRLRHKESLRAAELAIDDRGRYVVRVSTPQGQMEHTSLSMGEQNLVALALRVALARAIVGRLPIMLLDEPTEHLDEEHRRRIVELVRELATTVPIVVVTSHHGEFAEIADRQIELG